MCIRDRCRTALEGTHADVDVIATEGLTLTVALARDLVQLAARRPSVGLWRVIVIEDADRLHERAADALLKALEEPVARTVWILCAPFLEDVIITIRSRSRHVRLRTPPVEAVAALLVRRDGIDLAMATFAARAAQCHVGLARRLARAERTRLLETLGADLSARTQPPHVRSQVAALEKEQKTRATRFSRDVIDRSLIDLLSIYRDALVLHTGASIGLVNQDMAEQVQQLARVLSPERLLLAMDAIGTARERIDANVHPLLALEAMAISLQLPH